MYYYYLHNWPSDRSLLSGHLWFQSYALKFKRMNEHQNMWNKMIKAKASIKKYNFKDGFEKIVHSCCTEGVSGIKHLLIPRCLFNAESCVQKRPRRPTTSALAWVCQTLSLLRKKLSTPGPGGRLKTTSYAVVLLTISMEQLTWEWPGMQTLVSLIIVVCPICNVLYMLSTY